MASPRHRLAPAQTYVEQSNLLARTEIDWPQMPAVAVPPPKFACVGLPRRAARLGDTANVLTADAGLRLLLLRPSTLAELAMLRASLRLRGIWGS